MEDAAEMLGVPAAAVHALVDANLLRAEGDESSERTVSLAEVKSFLARNSESPADAFDVDLASDARVVAERPTEVGDLLDALRDRTGDMAQRSLEITAAAFPELSLWSDHHRVRFVEQASERFEVILAMGEHIDVLDDDLCDDLAEVGADAARSGDSLGDVLLTFRVSRDILVQTAVELVQGRGTSWAMPFALLLMRVLPAIDQLSDAVTKGWWDAVRSHETT
jgi:hypothetical protein